MQNRWVEARSDRSIRQTFSSKINRIEAVINFLHNMFVSSISLWDHCVCKWATLLLQALHLSFFVLPIRPQNFDGLLEVQHDGMHGRKAISIHGLCHGAQRFLRDTASDGLENLLGCLISLGISITCTDTIQKNLGCCKKSWQKFLTLRIPLTSTHAKFRFSANAKEPFRINRSGIAWRSVSPLPWAAKPAPLSNIILRRSLLLPFLRSMESCRNPAQVAASISSHMPWSKCDRRKTLRYNVIQQYPEKPTSITDFAGCIGPSKGFKRHYQQARHSHPGRLNIRRSFI